MIATIVLKIIVTKFLPVVIPPVVSAVRAFALKRLSPKLIPVFLTVGGALVGVSAELLGVDPASLNVEQLPQLGTAAWEGALVGLAATGLHSGAKNALQWYQSLKAKK
jgi:hypothetical protein